ncbi:MAG: TlpA disulfide reductase family protein [Brevundimonas sp.]|uniref:TlpA disulfide reductase family protein n=1 Tax=Brevundimonas sp. TaxID=1871086 RepID=UPI0024873A6D|nr:TlpA disulfide reductase family protein [Brevundimonas sp.]MDI1327246.1 TlpA disulfide reductase family protein [Brevundimonas sp.]
MNAIELGPLVLSGERFAIIVGVAVFLLGTGVLASRVSPRFNGWSTAAALGGLGAARLAHVITHWSYFADDPLRAAAVWQGGFIWPWALLPVAVAAVVMLRERRLMLWAAAPVIACALAWTATERLTSGTEPVAAPSMTLARLEGGAVNLATVDGRPTVINLWASWCPPCRREMPALARAQDAHPDVRFLFVNQGEGPAKVAGWLEEAGLEVDNVLLDPAMAVPRHYGTAGLPVTLFLGPDGRLARAHVGEIAPEQIDAGIARLR